MNVVILLICCGIALVTFLISLIGYPLIASMFDYSPFGLSLFIGIPLFLLTSILTLCFLKRGFIRRCVIIPCLFSVGLSSAVTFIRFEWKEYWNNYLYRYGKLYDNMGFCIISSHYDGYAKGIDENGIELIIGCDKVYINDEYKEYRIDCYDLQGNFIMSEKISREESFRDAVKSRCSITIYGFIYWEYL